jgi:hypothetical protein
LQKRLNELQDELDEKGKIVTNELARLYKVENNGSENDPKYATDFVLGAFGDDNIRSYFDVYPAKASRVYWYGEEHWQYGGCEAHRGSFHIKWLFMTPEEIKAEVDKKIAQIKEARKRVKEEEAERKAREKEERDRKEYERLKEKYEGNGKEKENG